MVNSLTTPATTTGEPVVLRARRPAPARARLAAVALLAGLVAAACGSSSSPPKPKSLKVAGVEHAIELSIHDEHGITAVVHCPSKVPVQDGFRFTCNADLAVGVYPVNVVEVTK
jgi:hypothetical protein